MLIPMTEKEERSFYGGATKRAPATGKLAGNLLSYAVMLAPAMIGTIIEGALAIKQAVEGEAAQPIRGGAVGFRAPQPFVRLAAVPSRSSVSYG